jgi:hypothetical protein
MLQALKRRKCILDFGVVTDGKRQFQDPGLDMRIILKLIS